MTDVTTAKPETDRLDPVLSPRPDLSGPQAADGSERAFAPVVARMERLAAKCRRLGAEGSGRAREAIRARPLGVGLSAVGAGVLLGLLLRR